VAVALPAVGGVALAWALDAPHFLFFALLSPVVAVGTWLSDRWAGRRTTRRARAAHAAELAEAEDRLAAALHADERAAEAASPDLAVLATAARRRSTDLWRRRRGDADALAVRIGTGPGESRVVRVDSDGSRGRERSDRLPVVVELAATGGLGVAGPREPAVGVLAGVLGQLAALHAPGEVELALLTTPDRLADWAWLRWPGPGRRPRLRARRRGGRPPAGPPPRRAPRRGLPGHVASCAGPTTGRRATCPPPPPD
jgi:S-DNA-T family DNA segregation ATPase FtsK/SpoIIIE